jgi:hypothetical protein
VPHTNWDIYNSLVINQIVQLTKRISVNGANLLLYYILNPNNQSPITIEGSEITITVNVEAEYTAIEVNGERSTRSSN